MKNREHKRKPLAMSVNIVCEGKTTACKLLDISVGGAKVQLFEPMEKDEAVQLTIERFGNFQGRVIWRDNENHGLKFLDDPEVIADALIAMALHG